MKYDISTFKFMEAFQEEKCECPLCSLERKEEREIIDTLLSELVMDRGFYADLCIDYTLCSSHIEKLYKFKDKLSTAIIIRKLMDYEMKKLSDGGNEEVAASLLRNIFGSKKVEVKEPAMPCYVCEKMKSYREMLLKVLIKLYLKNKDFKLLYENSRGFCCEHYNGLMKMSNEIIGDKRELEKYKATTKELQEKILNRLYGELEWFINKFDYRYTKEPWGTSIDALPRSIEKVIGNSFDI